MHVTLRRQLWLLRVYAVASALILATLAASAFRQGMPQNLGEITVERINVVDANGTLRLVISNKDRQHPGVVDGKVIDRPRPVAGLLLFNDEGDEVGGLTYSGALKDGARNAASSLNLDQLKQDQTVGIGYSESRGQRTAGLQVWDPPDRPISDLIEQLNAANAIQDAARREAAVKTARDAFPPRPRRVFVGKRPDRSAIVSLADADGHERLNMTVDAGGNPRIEFLDAAGKVVQRLPH
jgi:hypothetical protein